LRIEVVGGTVRIDARRVPYVSFSDADNVLLVGIANLLDDYRPANRLDFSHIGPVGAHGQTIRSRNQI
jgi:hypothetical protein